MLLVESNGIITRCYNGTNGSTSSDCGFSVNNFTSGGFGINFGFPVANRFVSATPGGSASFSCTNAGVRYEFPGSPFLNNINIFTFCTDEPESTVGADFMIIVF